MATITKIDLVNVLIDNLGLNAREAKEMVEAFFGEIGASLEQSCEVKLSGFGVFRTRDKPERPGRNPKTGEEIPISARRVVAFHPSNSLKIAVETNLPLIEKVAA
jgi:integration host factor subunit alpha